MPDFLLSNPQSVGHSSTTGPLSSLLCLLFSTTTSRRPRTSPPSDCTTPPSRVRCAIFSFFVAEKLEPDAYTWNALLCALYRAGRHAGVLQLFDRIRREHKSVLNLHIYNTALMSCQRLALWDRALQLLWEMEASEFSVTTASYNLVIGACEAARKPKVALQVYEHMVDRKHPPDTFTLSSLIRGCIWGSLWSKVDEILNQSAPDVSLYNAAVQGMYLVGNTNLARKLYNKMRKLGLKPDGKTRALVLQDLSGA